jgi:hypothetical protein
VAGVAGGVNVGNGVIVGVLVAQSAPITQTAPYTALQVTSIASQLLPVGTEKHSGPKQ